MFVLLPYKVGRAVRLGGQVRKAGSRGDRELGYESTLDWCDGTRALSKVNPVAQQADGGRVVAVSLLSPGQ